MKFFMPRMLLSIEDFIFLFKFIRACAVLSWPIFWPDLSKVPALFEEEIVMLLVEFMKSWL